MGRHHPPQHPVPATHQLCAHCESGGAGLARPRHGESTRESAAQGGRPGLHGQGLDGPCKGFWISFSVQPAATEGFKWEQ